MRRAFALLGLVLAAAAARADTIVLRDGDQVTGKIVSRGTRRIRLQTPYGLLVIPVDKVDRIKKDDGTEEQVMRVPVQSPTASPTPAPAPVRLVLDVGGNTFWQAWDPKTPPADPSLQFSIRLDDKTVASYVDSTLDPGDLPKAVVNSFAFDPEALKLLPVQGVLLAVPEVREGRVKLGLELPPGWLGTRRVRVSYQSNEGTALEPHWRDLTGGEAVVEVRAAGTNVVSVEQARGFMEFKGRQMKNVESFQVTCTSRPVSLTPGDDRP
jgi:hypothetical protein